MPLASHAAPGPGPAVRPVWRGVIHRYAAIVAVPLFAVLVARAGSPTHRLACAIYGIGVTTMLAVSAIYHSAGISPTARRRLRRVDHSTILLAIAGSYTGIGALALDGAPERRLLTFVWIAAVVGIAIRMTWLHAPYPVIAAVYVAVGWSVVIELNPFLASLGDADAVLVVAGGVLYSVGAAVYALRRPNPRPATFGYHEVFHALVVAAAAAHYAAAMRLV
ncbi:MAG TPA: hemolysin III family protein [Acidimicrobiales bacterium]